MDTYADDLAQLAEKLDLEGCRPRGAFDRRRRSRTLHRTPQLEACRQGSTHWRRSAHHAENSANPGGLPVEVFDGIRAGVASNRAQFYKDLTLPFYG
jgi:non-heme chloroperoxidase